MSVSVSESIRLVLIDDQVLARAGVLTFLSGCSDIQIAGQAAAAKEGLRLVEKSRPHIALVDLGLPDRDGITVIKEIREKYPEIKVIVLTVDDNDRTIVNSFRAGANAYCLKQKISEQLPSIIRAVHAGQNWLDPLAADRVLQALMESNLQMAEPEGKLTAENKTAIQKKYALTDREYFILQLLTEGKNNADIAKTLFVSYHTVKSDMTQVLEKLGVQDRIQAVIKALKNQL
jgi:DNA-binding NarL/FixJ family response regulator